MPGCVLRVSGDAFQSDSFLAGSSLTPCNVFHKGEPKAKDRVWQTSGMTIPVSDALAMILSIRFRILSGS
jgi:hypothetical protein